MLRTPEEVSKARQEIRRQADIWRAGVAATRRELAAEPAKQAELEAKIAYGQAQVALCAAEMKKLYRKGKRPFWPKN
jgi:hypothetical protein